MLLTTQRKLACKLTAEELDKAKTDLSLVCREEDDVDAERKAVAKHFSTRLEEVGGRRRVLVDKIQSRQEYRDVECEWRPDYLKGKKTLVRLDTNENVETVLLTERERQTGLELKVEDSEEPEGEQPNTLAEKLVQARAKRGKGNGGAAKN